jgi:hypothetical protein
MFARSHRANVGILNCTLCVTGFKPRAHLRPEDLGEDGAPRETRDTLMIARRYELRRCC